MAVIWGAVVTIIRESGFITDKLGTHADKDCFPGKPTLSARTDNMDFLR